MQQFYQPPTTNHQPPTTKRQIANQRVKFLLSLALLLVFYSCNEESFETSITTESIASKQKKHDIDFGVFEKSLLLGRDNFKVDWDSGEIVSYDKKGNKTTMEYDAYLQNAQHLASNVFNGNVIYKLVMVQKNKKVVDIVINRYEPYKGSSNTTPSYRHTNHYDGLKFTLEINGRIRNIEAFEKGEIVSSFQETRDTTSDAMDVEELSKAPVQCDPLSFYFDPERCTNLGGQTNGWVLETTYHYTDNYTKDSDGNYIINGDRYFYKNTTYNGASSRWVQVYQENPFILSYSSSRVDSETGGHTPLPYNPLEDEDRIFNELTGKAACVYEKLNELSNGFKNAIQKFDGDFPVSHLRFEMRDLGNTRAVTEAPDGAGGNNNSPDYLITIAINSNSNEHGSDYRPNLMNVKTIAHEVIHAEMYRKLLFVLNNGGNIAGVTKQDVLDALEGNFPGMYDYYRRYKNWQHQQMATHYRETIADILQSFDDNQHTRQFYMDLAWEGLIYELGNNAIYTWTSLSQEDRDRIKRVIKDYIEGNKNEDCKK